MSKLMKMTLGSCRGNGYLMIGVCLGLSLSLFMSPVEISDGIDGNPPAEENWLTLAPQDAIDEYLPKINLDQKPKIPQKIPKSLIRPRYYSTELGIREKLFVAISSSREHLHTRGIAINKTLGHLVDKVRYFITIPEGSKPNVSLPGIVGFTDTRDLLKPFHIIKYITDNYLEDYDYYFIIKDSSYINARGLSRLLSRLSVSNDVYLGSPSTLDEEHHCSLDSGIILSNSLVKKLKTNLDWCVKNTFSNTDSVNFGRCVQHSTDLQCTNKIDSLDFTSIDFTNLELSEPSGPFRIDQRCISVSSVTDHTNMYKLHISFAIAEIQEIEDTIGDIEQQHDDVANTSPAKAWPIGTAPAARPSGRFDLTRWNYFNATHLFMETDHENSREIVGCLQKEIEEVVSFLKEDIGRRYKRLKLLKVVNGWRRFDAARGVDYIVDVDLADADGVVGAKRFELAKSLGKAEILSVPYVTENSRVNLVVVVEKSNIRESLELLEDYVMVCMEKKDRTSLMVVLLYDPESKSKGSEDVYAGVKGRAVAITERFKKEGGKVSWLSVRLMVDEGEVGGNPMVRIGIADLVCRKFSPESLVMMMQVGAKLKTEFLNRVRMNTIMQFQIFSPIPFTEYNPAMAYSEDILRPPEIDINRNHGSYDVYNYDTISFYVKDYQSIRKKSEQDIPIVRNDKDVLSILKLSKDSGIDSIFELFVIYGDLHTFRAVEPALKISYRDINCPAEQLMSERAKIQCLNWRYSRLGHRGQLAKLILEYQNSS